MTNDCRYDTAELLKKAKASLMYVTDRPDIVFVKGKGSYLWDSEGRAYLDMMAGWAVCCLGHAPAVITEALSRQSQLLLNPSPSFYNEPAIAFADLLTERSCMDKVFFINSGAEANEGAIKLARKYGQKYKGGAFEIITAWHSFHGRTLATMAATGKEAWETMFPPMPQGFKKVPYNDIEALRAAVTADTCAIMLELVQGEGGVIPADQEYIRQVRQLCDEQGVLFIADEVQTGIGRLGRLFAYEAYGIEPDMMTLAKGIGGGFPLAALLAKDAVCCFEPGEQGGTYSMTPLATAVGRAVVQEVIESGLCDNVRRMGDYFVERLNGLIEQRPIAEATRGMGLLLALALREEKANEIKDKCMARGLVLNAPNAKTLRFMPSLAITAAEIDQVIDILDDVLREY